MKKEYRIKNPLEFQKLIQQGEKSMNASFVIYTMPRALDHARIGISVSKKAGDAVYRNYYKRQVRMMCQELIDFSTYPNDVIIIIRFNYIDKTYDINKKNLEKLLVKATIE